MSRGYPSPTPIHPHTKSSFENIPTPHHHHQRNLKFSSLKPTFSRGSKSSPASPPTPTPMPHRPKSKEAIAKGNKAKYPSLAPAPLANDLALQQFIGGCSMETNIQRYNKSQAKAMAPSAYRDGKGGVWMDQDEEWEYAGLLGGHDDEDEGETQWVEFSGNTSSSRVVGIDLVGEERRASIVTQNSDLDQDDLAAFGGKPPHVFTIPPRTIRSSGNRNVDPYYSHGAKPEFWPNAYPAASPPGYYRRPSWTTSQSQRGMNSPGPFDADKVRRDFLDGSFQPEPLVSNHTRSSSSSSTIHTGRRRGSSGSVLQPTYVTNSSEPPGPRMSKKPSRLNMKGLFRAVRR